MPSTLSKSKQLKTTTSLCKHCKRELDAALTEVNDAIYLEKSCPEHGFQSVLISSNAQWYHDMMAYSPILSEPAQLNKNITMGCPFDCGFCRDHAQQIYLPVIPITSSCNMNCPICYTINKNQQPYHTSLQDFRATIRSVRQNDPDLNIINLTGGEPTIHPEFLNILKICNEEGYSRITVSSNGLLFLRDNDMLQTMSDMDIRVVLSFNSFREEVNNLMLEKNVTNTKLQILELLEQYDIDTTLIPVLSRNINDDELGELVQLILSKPFYRSLEIHSMTFTGQGGATFDSNARLTTYDIIQNIETQTNGQIRVEDFIPAPVAHPLCYLTTYLLLLDDGDYVPFSQFISKANMIRLQTGNLYIEPDPELEEILRNAIDDLWSETVIHKKSDKILDSLKNLLNSMFQDGISRLEQQKIAERATKAIYIHSHMDEETFDTERIKLCCVAVPESDGSAIPTCAYNILYRERDERFAELNTLPLSQLSKSTGQS